MGFSQVALLEQDEDSLANTRPRLADGEADFGDKRMENQELLPSHRAHVGARDSQFYGYGNDTGGPETRGSPRQRQWGSTP